MNKLNKGKKSLVVKTGTTDEFFNDLHTVARAMDTGEKIKPLHKIIFEEPAEMLHFLTETKIKLINIIRRHPDSITNIAKSARRNKVAVRRDVCEMERFGLVKMREEINPGHGRHKIVEVVAPALKLEAYI